MTDIFSDVSDIFSDSDSDREYSVIRWWQNQTVHPFSDYSEIIVLIMMIIYLKLGQGT